MEQRSTETGEKKIGILIVAYNAATTLAAVLDRIPPDFRPRISEVIVSDDHSQDATYLVGLGYQQMSDLPITLIRQPRNLGYGGNQKAGYQVAIDHGLDIVVMLHGDGQYAPECLPERGRAPAQRRGRRRVRVADHDQGCGPQRGDAPVQVRGQPDPHQVRERRARHRPDRVPLRLPRLQRRRPEADPLRAELRRLQLRHPDHHPAPRRREAHRGGAHPDLLRRRDLLRGRAALRRRRHQGRHRLPHWPRRGSATAPGWR